MSSRRFSGVAAIGCAVLVLASLLSARSAAEQTRTRRFEFARSSSALLVSVDFPDLFDARARQKLDSGFWNRVVIRVNTRRVGQERPVALALQTCRVRYELWEEYYEIQVEDHVGRRTSQVESADQAIARCASIRRFPVASLSAMAPGRYNVEVIAELNPMSEELLDSIRRWLRSPQGGRRRLDEGDNFFGSVVSIFVNNRIGRSDRMLHFRSQPFTR